MRTSETLPRRVLILGDDATSCTGLEEIIRGCGFAAQAAGAGDSLPPGLDLKIDLVVLDLAGSPAAGADLFRCIRDLRREGHGTIPVMVATPLTSKEVQLAAFEAGANDLILKPVDPTEFGIRAASLFRLKDAFDHIAHQGEELRETVEQQARSLRAAVIDSVAARRDLQQAHLDTVSRMAIAAEFKDEPTGNHIQRMSLYAGAIGKALGLPPGEVETMRYAVALHDVGTIGIPDAILFKPTKLTPPEWSVMKTHTLIGATILNDSASRLLSAGCIVARTHHERWDGSGYPGGVAGEKIPLASRVCAVADVFNVMTNVRPYKPAAPIEDAFSAIRDGTGTHFDPAVIRAFLAMADEIVAIRHEHHQTAVPQTQI